MSVLSLVLAMTIFCVNSVVNTTIALADDSEGSVSETVYSVDDVRDLLGNSRKYGYEASESIFEKARELKLEEDQVKYIEEVLGGTYDLKSTNISALGDYVDTCVEEFSKAMRNGYAVEVVFKCYEEVNKAIESYEAEAGITWVQTRIQSNDRVMALLEEVKEFEDGKKNNAVVGNSVGFDLRLPMDECELTKAFEESENNSIEIMNGSISSCNVYNIFRGTVESIENDGQWKNITVKTSDDLYIIYSVDTTERRVNTVVEQGDIIGSMGIGSILKVKVYLDKEPVDGLYLFGSKGAYLKNMYIRSNPSSTLKDITDFKNTPDKDSSRKEDTGTIEGTFIE